MAIIYLHEPIENAVVISSDALFGIPDFTIREKVFSRSQNENRTVRHKQSIPKKI